MFGGLNPEFYQDNPRNDDSVYIDTSLLPLLYTPVYTPPNPWHRQSAIARDFIILAEFSEQEGPKPLMCIPKNGGDGFDLNAFSLRIMSVDTQSMTSKFSMPEDTQVVLSETRDGIYAYVHHFILHDSQARGFVRPYCMAYVTPDRKKIMTFYESLNGEFNKVSRYLKYGNLRLFHKDMINYLCDLKYTKERVRLEGDNLMDCSVESVELVEKEIESIINTVKPLLCDRHMERRFRGLDKRDRDGESSLVDAMGLVGPRVRRKSFLTKRSFSVECGQRGRPVCDTGYQPQLVNVHRRTFDRALRDLHGLCEWGAREGITRLRDIHKYFTRDTATLLLEELDSLLIEPRGCMLTIGGCITVNFLHKMDISDTSSTESLWQQEEPTKTRFLPSNINKWESTDTLESWKSAESFYSIDSSSYDKCHLAEGSHTDRKSCGMVSSPSGEDVFVDAMSHVESPGDELRDCLNSSDTESSPTHLPKLVTVNVQSCADHLDGLTEYSPGYGLLRLTNHLSFTPHLYASLLRGRPVCVLGKVEKDVRAVVCALTILVPGYSSSQTNTVILSQTKPIRLVDLSRVKLVGLVRRGERKTDVLVPETLKLYVTILDLDKRSLRAPIYDGSILKTVYNRRKNFSTDSVFLAYMHSLLLDISTKSFQYYHEYLLRRDSPLGADSHNLLSEDCEVYRRSSREASDYLHGQGLRGTDITIVQYLAEVIKLQQTEEYYTNVLGLSEYPAQNILLDLRQPMLFTSRTAPTWS